MSARRLLLCNNPKLAIRCGQELGLQHAFSNNYTAKKGRFAPISDPVAGLTISYPCSGSTYIPGPDQLSNDDNAGTCECSQPQLLSHLRIQDTWENPYTKTTKLLRFSNALLTTSCRSGRPSGSHATWLRNLARLFILETRPR